MLATGAICDKCKSSRHANGIHTKKDITAMLRKAGWTIGKRTICPKCRPTPKKKIIEE